MRDVPGPKCLPIDGSYYGVYPDHLGSHQHLLKQYGPVFKTTEQWSHNLLHQRSKVAEVCFSEGDFWSKKINSDHPFYGIKDEMAGAFLSNTNGQSWYDVHQLVSPALSPKAALHYTLQKQNMAEQFFKILDELDTKGEAWNVY